VRDGRGLLLMSLCELGYQVWSTAKKPISAPELTDSKLPGFGAPGLGRFSDQSSRRTHTQRLGGKKLTVAVNHAVGKTLTVEEGV
jgi:hypothetical protein